MGVVAGQVPAEEAVLDDVADPCLQVKRRQQQRLTVAPDQVLAGFLPVQLGAS